MANKKCNIPLCRASKAFARGLCNAHYLAIRRRIKKGEYTWEELQESGVVDVSSHEKSGKDLDEYIISKVKKK